MEKEVVEDGIEGGDVGENEDQDVKAERQKVAEILSCRVANPPVVLVHVSTATVIVHLYF